MSKEITKLKGELIDVILADASLTAVARLVGVFLARQLNDQPGNPWQGRAWPSQATIGAELGITERAARASVKALRGYFTVKRTKAKPGKNSHATYIPNRQLHAGMVGKTEHPNRHIPASEPAYSGIRTGTHVPTKPLTETFKRNMKKDAREDAHASAALFEEERTAMQTDHPAPPTQANETSAEQRQNQNARQSEKANFAETPTLTPSTRQNPKTHTVGHGEKTPIPEAPRQREMPVHAVVAGTDTLRRDQQALARRASAENAWFVNLQSRDGWEEAFAALPENIASEATAAELAGPGGGIMTIKRWWGKPLKYTPMSRLHKIERVA